MKKNFLLLLTLSISASIQFSKAQPTGNPACPMGKEWKLITGFSDEFNGNKLDDNRWWDFNPSFIGRKPSYFARENVSVGNGCLQLQAKVQDPGSVTVENKVRGFDKFTTATLKSKQRIKYGYFEARCKSMKASVCNAFWLYDPLDAAQKYKEGSFSEEIDIFEIFGKPTKKEAERTYYMTVHRLKTPYVETLVKSPTVLENKSKSFKVPFDFYADFHVYGFLWTPEVMKWYVDGQEVFSRTNDFFHSALHIMLDCEIMEAWAGLPDPSDLPSEFNVDYLRVWQKE